MQDTLQGTSQTSKQALTSREPTGSLPQPPTNLLCCGTCCAMYVIVVGVFDSYGGMVSPDHRLLQCHEGCYSECALESGD